MFFLLGVAGVILGWYLQLTEGERMRRNAIERGFAEYDAKTGEWKWRETQKEPKV